jgi:5-methylthioadenosine/S-adenosylhomocysteine deaminase
VMPGLINAHTHSGQIVDTGLGDNLSLDQWIVYAAYGGPPLTDQDAYALAAWSALTQLRTGCTACLDHPFVPLSNVDGASDAIMQAYLDTGFRAAVAIGLSDMDFFQTLPIHLLPDDKPPSADSPPPSAQQQLSTARRFVQRWQGKSERVRPYLGPSGPQRLSDELLAGCFELSRELDVGIHTHLLEARSQWFACQERFGGSPVVHLKRRGWLSPRLSCAHGVWLSTEDMRLLADSGAAVSHNPISNLRLASGIANLQLLLSSGVAVALGADGAASNDNQNMWEVVKLAGTLHKVYGKRRNWVSAAEALRLCLEGGASVLRQDLGEIAPGAAADLIILGGPSIFFHPKEQMIASLVLSELGQSVEMAIVDGEVVLENGRATKINEDYLRQQVAEYVEKSHGWLPRREETWARQRGYLDRLMTAVDRAEDGPEGVILSGR